jgi:hypothetical protein
VQLHCFLRSSVIVRITQDAQCSCNPVDRDHFSLGTVALMVQVVISGWSWSLVTKVVVTVVAVWSLVPIVLFLPIRDPRSGNITVRENE